MLAFVASHMHTKKWKEEHWERWQRSRKQCSASVKLPWEAFMTTVNRNTSSQWWQKGFAHFALWLLHCLCAGTNSLKLQLLNYPAKLSCSQVWALSKAPPTVQLHHHYTVQNRWRNYVWIYHGITLAPVYRAKFTVVLKKTKTSIWLPLAFKKILHTPTKRQSPVSEMSTCPYKTR